MTTALIIQKIPHPATVHICAPDNTGDNPALSGPAAAHPAASSTVMRR
ncbi:hypothetical protein [Nocardia donostiensis]|nr:hypothetical protein [Nocardia donostiensis]